MEIFRELEKDHVEVMQLMQELMSLSREDYTGARDLAGRIRDELIPHARAEEAVLYNSLRSLDSMKDVISHGYREHIEAEGLLRALQVQIRTHMDWRPTASRLKAAVENHIREEEGKVFEMARHLLTDEEAEEMSDAFLKLKPEIREEGIAANMLELTANLMPPRFAKLMRGYNLESRI